MATASSETTRTARSGCLDRTLEASSWTQIETLMRCAMPTSRIANSAIPELPSAGEAGSAVSRLSECRCFSSAHTARTAEGTLASTTASPSTIPMSSSSERCASLAESSSSEAILYDTLNARSLPSEPSAPAVALMPPPCGGWVTSEELKRASHEVAVVRGTIAWQGETFLTIRRLLLRPMAAGGRRGPTRRQPKEVFRMYEYEGCVFGVLLGHAIDIAGFGGHFRQAEVVRRLRECLDPAAAQLESCTGWDAAHLRAGFACHHVLRGQLLLMRKSSRKVRGGSRSGGVALGLSACMFFLVSMSAQNARHASSLDGSGEFWLECAASALKTWRWASHSRNKGHANALQAELCALKRGALGFRVGRREAERLQLDFRDSVRLQTSYMRLAMWPPGRRLDREAQAGLCEWIESADFISEAELPPKRGAWYTHALSLSALEDAGRDSDSEANSSCGSDNASNTSSGGSAHSEWSTPSGGSVGAEAAEAMNKLASLFNS